MVTQEQIEEIERARGPDPLHLRVERLGQQVQTGVPQVRQAAPGVSRAPRVVISWGNGWKRSPDCATE